MRRLLPPGRLQPLLLVAAACVALAAITSYDLLRERALAIRTTRANTANLARLLDEQMRQTLRRVESTLALGALRVARVAPAQRGGHAELLQQLQALLPGDGLVRGLTLVDAAGQPLLSTLAPPAMLPASASQAAPHTGGLAFGPMAQDRSGRWALPVSLRIGDAGAAEGQLVASVDTDTIQRAFNAVDVGAQGFVTLFLDQGWLLVTTPANPALFARNWRDTPLFSTHLPAARNGTVQQVVVRDQTERVYSYRALADFPLVVSVGLSLTDALAEWRTRVGWSLALLAAVVATLLAAAVALARHHERRARAEQALADNAEFLRQVTDNVPLRIAYVDAGLRYRFVNEALCQRYGLPRQAILGSTRQALTRQAASPAMAAALQQARQGEAVRFEHDESVDGQARVTESHVVPDVGPDGQVRGFYSASADVTERQQQQRRLELALAERETLLREVYHRVKNNLQVVQSLLTLQRRALPPGPAQAALDDSVQRIRAMALVHEKLYQTGTLSAVALDGYTADLLQQIGEAAGATGRGISLRAEVAPVQAALDLAVPFGLLVAELVGNSLKHGFPAGRRGSVRVQLQRVGVHLRLQVADSGVSLPADFDLQRSLSMGLQLAATLAVQLGGRLQTHDDGGAVFSSDLPRLG